MRRSPACTIRRLAQALRDDQSGVAATMLAFSLFFLLGAATVSVDLASVYLARRDLQGIADAAAMAAAQADVVGNRMTAAQQLVSRKGVPDVTVEALENGTYTRSKAVAYDQRFQPGGDQSAVRVTLVRKVPLFFAAALGFANGQVRAQSTATNVNMAAFSLGSRLAVLSGGIPNQILSALTGSQLNLSVMDTSGLASASVDVMGFAEALRIKAGGGALTYASVFGQSITLRDAILAMAAATSDSQAALLLNQIAGQVPYRQLVPADMIDLGAYASWDRQPTAAGVSVDAFSLLRSTLELSMGDSYDISFGTSVAGLSSVTVRITGGRGLVSSPWLTVASAQGYVLRTAQSRISVVATVGTGSPLLPSVTVPVYVELAEAQSRLSGISCTGDSATDGVTLGVTPAIGQIAIASFNANDMTDFSAPLTLRPATLVSLPLIASVTGYADIALGGITEKPVLFTLDDIAARKVKTVSTTDLTAAIASSLVSQTKISATALGLSLSTTAVTQLVGKALATAAPLLDTTLFSLTDALGVKVGAADSRVDKIRCGTPQVLA